MISVVTRDLLQPHDPKPRRSRQPAPTKFLTHPDPDLEIDAEQYAAELAAEDETVLGELEEDELAAAAAASVPGVNGSGSRTEPDVDPRRAGRGRPSTRGRWPELEESLAPRERGDKLADVCARWLDGARRRLDAVTAGDDATR